MNKKSLFKSIYSIVDVLILFSSFQLSLYLLRTNNELGFIEFLNQTFDLSLIFLGISLFFLLLFHYNGLYRVNILITRAAHLAYFIKSLYYGSLNIVIISLILSPSETVSSRFIIVVFLLIVIPTFYVFRIEIMRTLFFLLSRTSLKRNILILGDGKAGKMLASQLIYENPIGLNIVGFIDDNKTIGDEIVIDKKVIGYFNQIEEIIEQEKIDELIIADDSRENEELLQLIDTCKKLNVSLKVTSELFDVVGRKIATEKYVDIPVIDVSPQYNNKLTLTLKRTFDISISAFTLILFSPIMILISILIKITSPGPIFFRQTRVGYYGKNFELYKFRSMKVIEGEDEDRKNQMIDFMNDNSEELKTKIINDHRVTWIGNLIRKTSLDELPQLFNVILGDMSLVGPRPCLPYEYDNYDIWQKRRVNVTPGCTGVWQVWGRSSVSFKESVVLDLYYINNMSPWFDLQLIFQTVPVMLTARGAK